MNPAAEVARLVHAGNKIGAARYIADFCQLKKVKLDHDDPSLYLPVLNNYLQYLLNNDGMAEAAQILWTPTKFNPKPKYTVDIWDLYDRSSMGLLMGSGSTSKSFSMGVRMMLEWLRDPMWTTVKLVGPSEDHLERNLFSHIVGLHRDASLPLPGEVGQLYIGMDKRNQISSITGTVIPIGRVKKAGRLQGGKRLPRKTPHPVFGPLARVLIFIDEMENVPGGIWSDIDNVLSLVGGPDDRGFRIFGAYNPTNREDEVGKRAEPPFGWDNFDIEKHYKWKSKRGWDVLRLDGERCENVVQNKIVFPGLQTRAGLDAIAINAGGKTSAGYITMGRGAYPNQGVEMTMVPPGLITSAKGEYIWVDEPTPIAGCDLALEGGAGAIFTLGKWGRASGIKKPKSEKFPLGERVMFKDKNGQVVPRWGLQADQQIVLAKGDTVKMKDQVIDACKRAGVRGHYFACDRTGIGSGIADLMKHEWSDSIHDINYSSGASDTKLMLEDQYVCNEEYDRVATELWVALRTYAEFGYLLLNPALDMTNLAQQLTQRKSLRAGRKIRVESKADYRDRGFSSPDEADSLTLLVHAARKGSGIILSMAGAHVSSPEEVEDEWYNRGSDVRVDPSNRVEHLDML